MKIKDIDHMTPSVSSQNMIKESNESESNEGIWYDFDNVEDFIDSVDVKKFAYDITNHASFSEALNDYTVNDYENNEFGERTISWTLPDSGIDLAIRFDFPTFTDLTDFANSNYTKEDFMSHVEDVWSITDPNSNYNDFWSDMDELLSSSDYGYSEYTTDNDYDVNVSPTSIKFNSDGLCIDNDFHILEKVSTDLNFVKIPNDIALIKCFAFDGCSKLTDIVITGHIKYIDRFAFAGAVNLKNVYYVGSKKDWHKIKIGRDNENLTNANIHYNYKGSSNESLNGGTDMKIEESKSIKESLDEDLSRDSSYKDAKQLIEDIDKFLKEIEENGVSAQYFSSDDLDALHKGRDAIFDFTVVYEENGFPDALNQNVEYKLAFKPVNDVIGIDCVNGLINVVRSAGFNFNSARKIDDDYYITIICKPNDLSRAKLAIENCGFFKSWLKSNESIKPKFSKLTLVNESNVFRFIKYKK